MKQRTLSAGLDVSALGLGCMGMSEFYGQSDDTQSMRVLHEAVELGVNFFDTANVYGPHHNEELIGAFLAQTSASVKVATKFGIVRNKGEYERTLDNSPTYARRECEASLKRLGVERIDLYYVHRIDPETPIEETVGGLGELITEGKIAHIGLCEVSAQTLRRAHAEHPIAAVQSEYSLWTRDVEAEVLPTCQELGVGFAPYSPLGRGFLTGGFKPGASFEKGDFRAILPRFQEDALEKNSKIAETVARWASKIGATPAQLSLAWLLSKSNNIVPLPGTRRLNYLKENVAAAQIELSADFIESFEQEIKAAPVVGDRYTQEGMKGVNA